MKGKNMLGAVVTIAVALEGAYGIANWQAGDTQDDVEELERRVDIAQHDAHEVMVKIEVWDNVLNNIISEFEQELMLMETRVEGMGMSSGFLHIQHRNSHHGPSCVPLYDV